MMPQPGRPLRDNVPIISDRHGSQLTSIAETTKLSYNASLKLITCQVHGFGVQPTLQGIVRHLRGKGHRCRGTVLKDGVRDCLNLPLSSPEQLWSKHPPLSAQPVEPPVHGLRILPGYRCLLCCGQYLTTSLELMRRHCLAHHKVKLTNYHLWEPCELQSFFQETKHRKYFRVRRHDSSGNDATHVNVGSNGCDTRGLTESTVHINHTQPPGIRCLPKALRVCHPFAQIAKRHVSWLSLWYIDNLFKLGSYQAASEPLFDPGHVDSEQGMQAVFPHCHDDSLFYHALLFSMVQRGGHITPNACAHALGVATAKILQVKLRSTPSDRIASLIGAILILKTTAYKSQDLPQHTAHANGLSALLDFYGRTGIPRSIERALFWQDTYATLMLGCPRQVYTTEVFSPVVWPRSTSMSCLESLLPRGFFRCGQTLPSVLAECIVDLLDLQAELSKLRGTSFDERYYQLDSMQASIELRLVTQAQTCRSYGPMAEAMRLSIFLCCYCSWTEIWNDSSTPCKIVSELFGVVESILATDTLDPIWQTHPDLLMWFLFVGSSILEPIQHDVGELDARRRNLLLRLMCAIRNGTGPLDDLLDRALQDYIYCAQWVQNRWWIKDWVTFETARRKEDFGKVTSLLPGILPNENICLASK